jgi:hypothetical protein
VDHETRVPVRSATLMVASPTAACTRIRTTPPCRSHTEQPQAGRTHRGRPRSTTAETGNCGYAGTAEASTDQGWHENVMINWRVVPAPLPPTSGVRTNRGSPPCNYDFADPCISGTVRPADWLRLDRVARRCRSGFGDFSGFWCSLPLSFPIRKQQARLLVMQLAHLLRSSLRPFTPQRPSVVVRSAVAKPH